MRHGGYFKKKGGEEAQREEHLLRPVLSKHGDCACLLTGKLKVERARWKWDSLWAPATENSPAASHFKEAQGRIGSSCRLQGKWFTDPSERDDEVADCRVFQGAEPL